MDYFISTGVANKSYDFRYKDFIFDPLSDIYV